MTKRAPPEGGRLTNQVLDFLPSRHGLAFPNRFPPGPTITFGSIDPRRFGIGDASAGLCGGMCFTVRDLFEHRIDPPADCEPPPNGTRRFRSLVRRQVESLDWLRLPFRFYALSTFHPDRRTWWSTLLRRRTLLDLTLEAEWPQIRREIDAGRLAMVGLVRTATANPFRLVGNHQVLAYGYRTEPGLLAVRLYDPNWPRADDVEVRIRLGPDGRPLGIEASTGEPLRGFFFARYEPRTPRAWLTG